VNVTPIVHFCPAPTAEPQVLLATAKSPLTAGDEMDRAVVRWLVKVTVLAVLVVPTVALANVRLVAESATGEDPVPLRFTICGLFAALSVKVSVPVRMPVKVGMNVTPTLQFAPAAMLDPQVFVAIEKSPVVAMLVKESAIFW
jgi:hypothetical protein